MMGTAHATCDITFYGVDDFVGFAGQMLQVLTERWVRPQSMLVYVSGHADSFAKLPGSVDGPRPTPGPDRDSLLCGERLIEDIGLTMLEPSDSLPSWPRDFDMAMLMVRQVVDRDAQLRASGEDPYSFVFCQFWGNTRVVAPSEGDLLTYWALRERVSFSNGNTLERIGQFGFTAEEVSDNHRENTFSLHFCTYSHIWSHYQPRFDVAREEWPRKLDLTAARENARIAAATFAELLRAAPAAGFCWEFQNEHSPDADGDLRQELARRLGAERVRHSPALVRVHP